MLELPHRIWEDGALWHWQISNHRGQSLGRGATDTINRARVEAWRFALDRFRHFDAADADTARRMDQARQALLSTAARAHVSRHHQDLGIDLDVKSGAMIQKSKTALAESRELLARADALLTAHKRGGPPRD